MEGAANAMTPPVGEPGWRGRSAAAPGADPTRPAGVEPAGVEPAGVEPAGGSADPGATVDPQGVDLSDVHPVLSLFTQGLASRPLHLRPAPMAAGAFRPDAISTDGDSIFLPPRVEGFGDARANFALYRMAVLHQLGYYQSGTFGFELEAMRARDPTLPPPPRSLFRDASHLERLFAMWRSPQLMRRLFVLFEDLRVDRALPRRYPGAAADLRRILAHALSLRPALAPMSALDAVLECLTRYSLGASPTALLTEHPSGLLARLLAAAEARLSDHASVYDSAAAAVACMRLIEASLAEGEILDEGDDLADPALAGDPKSAGPPPPPGGQAPPQSLDDAVQQMVPVGFRGQLKPDAVQRKLPGGMLLGDADLPPEIELAIEAGDDAADEAAPVPVARPARVRVDGLESLTRAPRSFLYDEWDFHGQRYLKGWCRVVEYRLDGEDTAFVHRVRERHADLAREILRGFKRVKPESIQRVRKVLDGTEIDLDGAIKTVVDLRAGCVDDGRIYTRQERATREVAAAFLVDLSASTDFPIERPAPAAQADTVQAPDRQAQAGSCGAAAASPPAWTPDRLVAQAGEEPSPYLWALPRAAAQAGGSGDAGARGARADNAQEPPKRRVIDVEKESLALIGDALDLLGDSHAIYGFSGDGREQVEVFVAKAFGERPSSRVGAALAAMKPRRATRMGPAIRHALTRLRRQPERIKLMIVISDGYPQDHDYGPDRGDEEYGIQDTAQALREAERAGVQTFCITVDPAGNDYLRRMCEPSRYLVIDELEALPAELAKLYRLLSAGAITRVALPSASARAPAPPPGSPGR